MIDNNHLAYAGVIVVFLLGLTVVALVGMFCLAVGFAVSMTVRFRKRQARKKRLNAAAPVPVTKKDGIPSLSLDSPNEGTDGQGRGRRRAADLPPVMNSVSL